MGLHAIQNILGPSLVLQIALLTGVLRSSRGLTFITYGKVCEVGLS